MTGQDIALIISSFGTLLTAAGGVYIAIATRNVHKLVNQEATDAKRYRVVLQHALEQAGVPLPVDQSVILQKDVKNHG